MKSNDLSYLYLESHSELLRGIVKADLRNMTHLVYSSPAVSMRADGVLNRMQVHKNHLDIKVVNQNVLAVSVFWVFKNLKI